MAGSRSRPPLSEVATFWTQQALKIKYIPAHLPLTRTECVLGLVRRCMRRLASSRWLPWHSTELQCILLPGMRPEGSVSPGFMGMGVGLETSCWGSGLVRGHQQPQSTVQRLHHTWFCGPAHCLWLPDWADDYSGGKSWAPL